MRTPGETGREEDPPRQRSPINRFVRAVLGLFAAPRVNMREDYEKVRRFQRQLIAPRSAPTIEVDYMDAYAYRDHNIPERILHPRQQLRDDVLLFYHCCERFIFIEDD